MIPRRFWLKDEDPNQEQEGGTHAGGQETGTDATDPKVDIQSLPFRGKGDTSQTFLMRSSAEMIQDGPPKQSYTVRRQPFVGQGRHGCGFGGCGRGGHMVRLFGTRRMVVVGGNKVAVGHGQEGQNRRHQGQEQGSLVGMVAPQQDGLDPLARGGGPSACLEDAAKRIAFVLRLVSWSTSICRASCGTACCRVSGSSAKSHDAFGSNMSHGVSVIACVLKLESLGIYNPFLFYVCDSFFGGTFWILCRCWETTGDRGTTLCESILRHDCLSFPVCERPSQQTLFGKNGARASPAGKGVAPSRIKATLSV